MVSADIIRRFVTKIKEAHNKLNEPIIEKDFYLTLLLNEISKRMEENKESPFCKLVFKGGTLLTKSHLNYHRLSEDLDFTYSENEKLNRLLSKQRRRYISNYTSQLADELAEVSKILNIDFSANKADKRYCSVMDRNNVYLFRIHYKPVYGAEEFIKFEVNFNDELICPPLFENIKYLFDEELIKDLEFIERIKIKMRRNIPCYDLKEVAAEKIRALLTRSVVKERDLFDLFLISNKIDIYSLGNEKIVSKIISSKSFVKGLSDKIKNNLTMLIERRYGLVEEKSKLALIDVREGDYLAFEENIHPLLIEISNAALDALRKK